jgi:hypothetical protein
MHKELTLTLKAPKPAVPVSRALHPNAPDAFSPARLVGDMNLTVMKLPVGSKAAVLTAGGAQKEKA